MLKHEITVSLALKLVALIAIGLALFGPDDRVRPTPDAIHRLLAGERP
ncbi:MAG TPA: phosphoglycerate mutase [Candidatus Omnitrophota bacterium]|nr:phosphoglycerate mutase [Candidatus Omnitrophota bacterium]